MDLTVYITEQHMQTTIIMPSRSHHPTSAVTSIPNTAGRSRCHANDDVVCRHTGNRANIVATCTTANSIQHVSFDAATPTIVATEFRVNFNCP